MTEKPKETASGQCAKHLVTMWMAGAGDDAPRFCPLCLYQEHELTKGELAMAHEQIEDGRKFIAGMYEKEGDLNFQIERKDAELERQKQRAEAAHEYMAEGDVKLLEYGRSIEEWVTYARALEQERDELKRMLLERPRDREPFNQWAHRVARNTWGEPDPAAKPHRPDRRPGENETMYRARKGTNLDSLIEGYGKILETLYWIKKHESR